MARTLQKHRARIGSDVEVLVEDRGFGRSRENWTVHFEGEANVGDLVRVGGRRSDGSGYDGICW